MINENKKILFESIIIFILTLTFNLICNEVTLDEIWNYGFSYNIANGLIPYKDFNMIITPFFSILGSIFMLIFGKNLLIYNIFNAIICVIIYFFIKKQTPKYYLIVYSLLLFISLPNYSLFCLLLLYIIINKDKGKSNDYLIGILLGLTFLTKQNIGIFLCVPTLFAKDIKKILKRIFGFIIPTIFFLIYLLYTNTLYSFIDYTLLGMNNFIENNISINKGYIAIFLITSIYLISSYIKNKDIKLIYLLCFQGMAIPIFDSYHTILAFVPVFGEMLNKIKIPKNIPINKFISIGFITYVVTILLLSIYSLSNTNTFLNDSDLLKYKRVNNNLLKEIINSKNYIKEIEDELYITNSIAYILKLENNIKINKFDLLNNGNLGSKGIAPLIEEINNTCSNKKCTFILKQNEIFNIIKNQYNREIIDYIITEYKYKESIPNTTLLIYKNY